MEIVERELQAALERLKELDEENRELQILLNTREKELRLLEQCRNDHKALVDRLAFLRQRKDLPLDRIPAYKRLCYLQASARIFCNAVETGMIRSKTNYGNFKRALGDWTQDKTKMEQLLEMEKKFNAE